MIADARQARISAYLQKAEFASLDELAREVDASISTVRRDLGHLETAGIVMRTHGGARLAPGGALAASATGSPASGGPKNDEYAFAARNTREIPEKEAIARACAALVPPNQTVILDAGSTVFHVAQHLAEKPLQIVTNSLPVANLFASAPQAEVVVCGGMIYPRLGVLVGPLAVEAFGKVHADIAIMGASGVTTEGIFNSHGLLIDMQQAMLRAARQVIFCFDHTKFDRRSMFYLGDFSRIETVVTDSGAPAAMVAALREKGVQVVVAPPV